MTDLVMKMDNVFYKTMCLNAIAEINLMAINVKPAQLLMLI